MERHHEIEDQAAIFLARRDSGDWTPVDRAELEHWLAASTARRVGFLRLEAAWDEARRLKALSAGLAPGTVPLPGEWRHTPFFDSDSASARPEVSAAASVFSRLEPDRSNRGRGARIGVLSLAASVLVVLGIGAYFTVNQGGDRYSTPLGGIASVPLADGSHLTLNTATQVRVELTARERHIRLDNGEAFFEVAHDTTRPFVVQVGNKRVIAVGTKFSVRRTGDDIRVIVTEGKVRVESRATNAGEGSNAVVDNGATRGSAAADPAETIRSRGPGEVFLTPGSIASAGEDGVVVEQKPLAEAEDDLSWREGYLTFHDTSLADAAAEFNRYNAHKIEIQDPSVAAIRISGSFRALNYGAFVRVLGDGFAIHARSTDDTTTLSR